MNETELKETLMKDARHEGICAEGYAEMRGYDRVGLIRYYLANPDWCMERDFPSLELLRCEFSGCEDKGIFVDRIFNGELLSKNQVYVFHHCVGAVRIGWNPEEAIIPMLYFANGCELTVTSDGAWNPNPVPVPAYVFGRNRVEALSDDSVKFTVFNHDTI